MDRISSVVCSKSNGWEVCWRVRNIESWIWCISLLKGLLSRQLNVLKKVRWSNFILKFQNQWGNYWTERTTVGLNCRVMSRGQKFERGQWTWDENIRGHCHSLLCTSKLLLFDRMLENIKSFERLGILESSAFEKFDLHIRPGYQQKLQRTFKIMKEALSILIEWIWVASLAMKRREIGAKEEARRDREELLNDGSYWIRKRTRYAAIDKMDYLKKFCYCRYEECGTSVV